MVGAPAIENPYSNFNELNDVKPKLKSYVPEKVRLRSNRSIGEGVALAKGANENVGIEIR